MYLLTFNIQPEGTYFESYSYPRSESISAKLNFDSILDAIKNEGFEPAGYNDVSTFISNSNAGRVSDYTGYIAGLKTYS